MAHRKKVNYPETRARELFPIRFAEAINKNFAGNKTAFMAQSGFSTTRIGNWIAGTNLPDMGALIVLANVLDVSTDWLLGLSDAPQNSHRANNLIEVHMSANEYDAMKARLLADVQEELWLIFRTGQLTMDDSEKILLTKAVKGKKFKKLRLLVCHPQDSGTMDQVRFRREPEHSYYNTAVEDVYRTLASLITQFEKAEFIDFENPDTLKKFEVYYSRYMPGVLAYIADPYSDHGQMVIIEAYYKEVFKAGLSFHLQKKKPTQAALFQYYLADFSRMLDDNYEAPPRDNSKAHEHDVMIVKKQDLREIRKEADKYRRK